MFKVYITENVENKNRSFVESYRAIYFSLYSDTGIKNESEILQNYRNLSLKLAENIDDIIFDTLEQNIVLGRKEIGKDTFEIMRRCEGFYIRMIYSENLKLQERTITNISFYKK